ncbi:MAG: SMC-Scp complex subunit ScpB [Bryobacterales bacterium]|nr:SMC-Scp complex subunit ScpB [Bryobacterales bacterium]
MDEKEILAATEQPDVELLPEAELTAAVEGPEALAEVVPGEIAPGDEGEVSAPLADEVQVSLSAEQLLGEQEQPQAESDTQAAELKAVLEAIIYLLNEPMPVIQIAQALGRDVKEVEPVLKQLAEESNRPDRGIFFREVAGGYQMATKPEHHEILRSFVQNLKQPLKLSQAALETLAVIAYKQPITMPEILEIRGVQGGGVVKTLIDRKLITTAGRKNVIGKPMLYKTTKEFLTQFGLRDVQELPSLKEFEEIRRQSMADDELEAPVQETLPMEPELQTVAETEAAEFAEAVDEPQAELPAAPVAAVEAEAEAAAEPPKEENA